MDNIFDLTVLFDSILENASQKGKKALRLKNGTESVLS
jgi:hypothetical protein